MLYRLLILLLLCQSCKSQTTTLQGEVVSISDGDTFTLLTADKQQIKIRLHGIDAPEYDQPFSKVSRQFLADKVFRNRVSVQQRDVDRYGRVVGIVTVDGVNVNEALLKAGLVWHYKRYDNPVWAQLEAEARQNKAGLWADKNPIPPWEWRHR
jgi:endonuclease YncB( thermonuclease family)